MNFEPFTSMSVVQTFISNRMGPITKVLYFVIFILFAANAAEVTINKGILKGKTLTTRNGRSFNAFTGIPYGKPPIGALRFKPPEEVNRWEGVLDATKVPNHCIQMNVYVNNFNITGVEDCLYLNVYTPKLPKSNDELLPVLFYIHGGGWMCNSGYEYGPNFILDKDVVLVTTNYRLGALGFLTTGDEVVPGNNGLKDQNFALRWVKENIAHFSGNPDKITIFGQSAGGASTHYHMLSPLSKDLFHRAIAHSGTVLGTWALNRDDKGPTNSKKLAEFLNCPTATSQDMVECLRRISAEDIIKQDTKFTDWSYDPMIPFAPVIEPNLEGAFISEHPVDIIKSGKAADVPFVVGITSEDGAFKAAITYNDTNLVNDLKTKFNKIAPLVFEYEHAKDTDSISNKIKNFYFGEKQIDESVKEQFTNMITDGWFLLPADAAVQLHRKYSEKPVYYYLFAYKGTNRFAPLYGDSSHDYGVCHNDELIYLFDMPLFPNNNRMEADDKMIDVMTTLWTDFAKTGNPTPKTSSLIPELWTPVKNKVPEYFLIKSDEEMRMKKGLYEERAQFWRDIGLGLVSPRNKDEL